LLVVPLWAQIWWSPRRSGDEVQRSQLFFGKGILRFRQRRIGLGSREGPIVQKFSASFFKKEVFFFEKKKQKTFEN